MCGARGIEVGIGGGIPVAALTGFPVACSIGVSPITTCHE